MPNSDTPFGLRPVKHLNGAPYNGAYRLHATASGDSVQLLIGDPVTLSGTSQTINGQIYSDVKRAATGDILTGICTGVEPATRDDSIYRVASTATLVKITEDPDLLFEAQEVTGGTALAAADIGLNIDFVVTAGSTVTGQSGVELNNATEAATNTLDLHIVGFVARSDNAIGEHAKWLVSINRSQYRDQVAGKA